MQTLIRIASLALLAGSVTATAATDPCGAFKWDVSREVTLFAGEATLLTAAATPAAAPAVAPERLYALTLQPQETVRFAVTPTKRMLDDGAFGGIVTFTVPQGGAWRVAIDAGFWLDVLHEGKPLPTLDFNGSSACPGPRKVVVYELPAGKPLTLQLAASSSAKAKLTVTRVDGSQP